MKWHGHWAGALLILVGATVPAQGQQVKLELKFKEGQTFYVETISNMKQTIEVMDNKIQQDLDNTTVASFAVKKSGPDGTVLEQKIEAVKLKGTGQLGAMAQMGEQMKGTTLTLTMGPTGQITKFEGYEDLIKKLSGGKEDVAKMVRMMLTEDTFKQAASEAFGYLPDKPVSKGDKWKREMNMPFGPIGTFKAENEYTYLGKGNDGEEIGLTTKMEYTPPKEAGGLPFKITKGDFKAEDAKGTIVFDADAGRPLRSTMSMHMNGTMTIEAGGQTAQMKMSQDQSTKVRFLDKKPAE